jgi:hypothetical protein
MRSRTGIPRRLQFPGLFTHAREPPGGDKSLVTINRTTRSVQTALISSRQVLEAVAVVIAS